MDNECLCLTWNNHGETYQQMLNLLRIENILTDCTLACDGQKFSVHRLVLVTCSDFFRSLLGDVPCQHPIIFLRGINGREMQALIDFMYMGKIDVPQKEVPELLSTAEILQIKGLGVLNSDNKSTSDKKESCKRKRSPLCNSKSFETCQTEKNSSPLLKYDACETSSSDKDYPSKISRRDWMGHSVNNEEFAQTSGSHPSAKDSPYAQNKDKSDCFKSESILSSIFKSSPINSVPMTISSSFENSFDSATSTNYSVSTAKTTPKDSLTMLTPLTSLQAIPPKHSKPSVNYYGNRTECIQQSSINVSTCLNDQSLGAEEGFVNLSEVKEEALDYTRASTIDASEIPNLPASQKDSSATYPKHDTSHFLVNLPQNSNIQSPYLQDENAENGAESGRPYLCPICRKSFAKVAILKRHHLAHFRPYNCHLCPRSFTRREVLAEHVLEHNGADLRLPCPVCKMTIKRKRNLQAHIKVKHPEYLKEKTANNEALC